MIIPFPNAPLPRPDLTPTLKDIGEILHLLSYSLAVIASPKISIEAARTTAKHAQNTAEAYAKLISACVEQGGAV